MKKTLTLIASVLAGALLLWVSRYCYLRANDRLIAPEKGGAIMENARVLHYAQGKELVDFHADTAEISSDQGVIKSSNVKGRFAAGADFSCGALHYNSYEKTIRAFKGVQIRTGDAEVRTEECRLLADNHLLFAPREVTIASPRGKARAARGTIDLDACAVRLNKTEITIFTGK
ncbi:MAG: hypothetical protein IJT95_01875 [Abditibacteriota bacterium]|nr:hypothetical protein [Abditibacteriota bacterium]